MQTTLILVLATAVAVAAADPKPGIEGTPEYKKAADLVRLLGSTRFADRESAAKELVAMGGTAVPALTAGTKSTDEEVRNRSIALLPKAVAAEWDRRASAFMADGKPRDLPLLAEFEKVTGPLDAGSRKLFAAMLRHHGPLLELAAADRKAAIAALSTATHVCLDTARVPGNQVKAPTGDWAALLFVHAILTDKTVGETVDDRYDPCYLLGNPGVAEAIDAKDVGPAVRRLLIHWIGTRPKTEIMSGLFFSLLAYRKPFPEAVPPLVALVKEAKSPLVRVVAPEALGKNGSKQALDALTCFLTDTSIVYSDIGGKDVGHQVRDCALAALAHRANREPTEFGLISYLSVSLWFAGTADSISLHVYGFKSAEDRKNGLKKLQELAGKK